MPFIQSSALVAAGVTASLYGRLRWLSVWVGFFVFSVLARDSGHQFWPDVGHLLRKYPKYSLLYGISFVTSGFSNQPIRELLVATTGRLSPDVRSSTFALPDRCILLMHHRRHHHPGLAVQEFHDFAGALDGRPFKVITGRDTGRKTDLVSRLLQFLEGKLYGSIDVRGCQGSQDCGFKLLEPFLSHTGKFTLVVFPDKFGSQFAGDTRMFYREGAFAASMALGVPVVDTLSMYPTFAHDYHTFLMTRIAEPPSWTGTVTTPEAFRHFKDKHAASITAYTRRMESLFLEDVKREEANIMSCDAAIQTTQTECKRCTYKNTDTRTVCVVPN